MVSAYYQKKQRGPVAMAMYAIGTRPLINKLNGIAKHMWYADDSAAGSSLERLAHLYVNSSKEKWSNG